MGYYHESKGDIQYVNAAHINVHHKICGELLDRKAALNDPIFWSFHANVDRSLMTWQLKSEQRLQRRFWRYPRTQRIRRGMKARFSAPFSAPLNSQCAVLGPMAHPQFKAFDTPWQPGTLLHDVVNDGYPFRNLLGERKSCRKGYSFK